MIYLQIISIYIIALTLIHFAVLGLSVVHSRRYYSTKRDFLPGSWPPITIVIPAYNEMNSIAENVRLLLKQKYSLFEIIVVDDGSSDDTIHVLKEKFALRKVLKDDVPEYCSQFDERLRLLSNYHEGKGTAIYLGAQAARYPYVCILDADTVMEKDTLSKLIVPFLSDGEVVAVSGIVRPLNNCQWLGNELTRKDLPKPLVGKLQTLEYIKYTIWRDGWNIFNCLPLIIGNLGLFKREALLGIGKFNYEVLSDDYHITVAIHNTYKENGIAYRITSSPEAIAWSQIPDTIAELVSQRIRWTRGYLDVISSRILELLGRKKIDFIAIAEAILRILNLGWSLIDIVNYVLIGIGLASGNDLILKPVCGLVMLSCGANILLLFSAIVYDRIWVKSFVKVRDTAWLAVLALLFVFIWNQIMVIFILWGLARKINISKQWSADGAKIRK